MKNEKCIIHNQSLILLALTLAAFALRVYRLDFQSLWIDEGWTVYFAHLPLAELWHWLQTEEIHPPFYFPAMHEWVRLTGDSDFTLRYFSAAFSALSVPLMYQLGKTLGGARTGLLAALLLMVSPYQIWHAQDARNYALLTATALMSMWAFFRLLTARNWHWWWFYLFGTSWAILTHYHGLVLIGVQGLFLLLWWKKYPRATVRWGLAQAVMLVPYVPWVLFNLVGKPHWLSHVPLVESYVRSGLAYSIGEMVPRPLALWLAVPFVLLFGWGAMTAFHRPRGRELVSFLLIFTFVPNIAAWVYGELFTPVYLPRYLIPVQIGFLLTIALGIDALAAHGDFRSRRRLAMASMLLLIGISGWVLFHHYTDPLYAKPDWRGVAQTIEAFQLPDDGILMTGTGGEFLFDHYYHGGLRVRHDFNTPAPSPPEAEKIIAQIAAENTRLWFTPYGEPLDPLLEKWLAENAFPAWQKWVGRKNLLLYRTGNPVLARQETENATFGAAVLETISLPDAAIAAGDLLPLESKWHAVAPIGITMKISLRLENAAGDIFARSDFPPFAEPSTAWAINQPVTDRRALWIPADTPPGLYDLQMVVYDGATGQPLGDAVTIAAVPVSAAVFTPPVGALDVPRNRDVSLGAVSLVGAIAPQTVAPGEFLWLWLYLRADESAPPNTPLQFTVTDGTRTETIPLNLQSVAGDTGGWRAGQIRRTIVHLPTGTNFTGDAVTVRISAGNVAPQTVAKIEIGD